VPHPAPSSAVSLNSSASALPLLFPLPALSPRHLARCVFPSGDQPPNICGGEEVKYRLTAPSIGKEATDGARRTGRDRETLGRQLRSF